MQLTFTNATGKAATFAYAAANPTNYTYMLDTFDGSSAPVNVIQTTGYNQNGSTYSKSLLKNRTLKLAFWVSNDTDYSQQAYLASVFTPTLGKGTLTITTSARTRYIDCFVSSGLTESGSQGRLKHYTVSLEAPIPFYYGSKETVLFSNTEYEGVSFPITFNKYVTFDYNGLIQTITNDGDVACPVSISIKNTETSNPKLTCVDNNEFIGVNYDLKETDTLLIDTSYGNKILTINGKNMINYINPASTWVTLPVGRSLWKFSADETNPVLSVSWQPLYNSF